MLRLATHPVYDEHGDLVGHCGWREIPILFKDNWYLERGTFHLGRPKDTAPPTSAHEQVRLIVPEGALDRSLSIAFQSDLFSGVKPYGKRQPGTSPALFPDSRAFVVAVHSIDAVRYTMMDDVLRG